jgi:hypothetical protein
MPSESVLDVTPANSGPVLTFYTSEKSDFVKVPCIWPSSQLMGSFSCKFKSITESVMQFQKNSMTSYLTKVWQKTCAPPASKSSGLAMEQPSPLTPRNQGSTFAVSTHRHTALFDRFAPRPHFLSAMQQRSRRSPPPPPCCPRRALGLRAGNPHDARNLIRA